ncbi:hypothetical protein B0T18DRAFT_457564 [Schizothecium vesticola]|uniref:Uncharacterized protein n=1 Tax=Schizothecium vesticola TaxID=314040 RepID=A0AA40KA16_9PEZI|nr:hypothetical protein B0T18DRAFT_457564 [Schizothecium vesticola]
MCRQYEHSVWRCTKKYDCSGYSVDSSQACWPRRPQFVACKSAIERARTAASLFVDLGANPIRTPFALSCQDTLGTIESTEGEKENGVVLGMYCPRHVKHVTQKMHSSWEKGMAAALAALPHGNDKVESHVRMYGSQIKFVVEAYAACLAERAVATGEGEAWRLVRKLQGHLLRQLIYKEIPSFFCCEYCTGATLPPLSGLVKTKRKARGVWELKAYALIDVLLNRVNHVVEQHGMRGFPVHEYHEGWAFSAGRFLFKVDETRAPDLEPGSGAHRFWENMNIQMRFMDEVEAMIGPSHAAKRRARQAVTRDYPNVRTTDETSAPDLFYDTSEEDSGDDLEDSASEIGSEASDDVKPPKRTHFSLELHFEPRSLMNAAAGDEMMLSDGLEQPSSSKWAEAAEADDESIPKPKDDPIPGPRGDSDDDDIYNVSVDGENTPETIPTTSGSGSCVFGTDAASQYSGESRSVSDDDNTAFPFRRRSI